MDLIIKGRIFQIEEIRIINDHLRIREVVITRNNGRPYPNVKVEFINADTQMVEGFKVGDAVEIPVEVQGKTSNKDGRTRYFTDLRALSIETCVLDTPSESKPETSFDEMSPNNADYGFSQKESNN